MKFQYINERQNRPTGIFLLVIALLIILNESYILAGIFALGGLIYLTIHKAIEFDLERRRYRYFYRVILFKIGEFEILPELDYILIKDRKFTNQSDEHGYNEQFKFEISVVSVRGKKIVITYTDIPRTARSLLGELHESFNIEIIDKTRFQGFANLNLNSN